MTLFGIDISHYQAGFPVARMKAQGYEFLLAKCTEGSTYKDPSYATFRAQAEQAGLLFAAYHFLHAGNVAGQVANLAGHIGDKSIPVMIDCEPTGRSRPTLADAKEFAGLCAKRGIKVTLLYFPGWYRSQVAPSSTLTAWKGTVQSAYPSTGHDYGSKLYPGDRGYGWNNHGSRPPTIWQFASSGKVDGFRGNVDLNAFRGTRAQAAAYFKDYAPHKVAAPAHPRRPNADAIYKAANQGVKGNPKGSPAGKVFAKVRDLIKPLTGGGRGK